MSRKPAHLEMRGGKSPRQRIWEEIRRQRAGFSAPGLGDALKIHPDTVRTYLKSLDLAGIIVQDGAVPPRHGGLQPTRTFRLDRDLGGDAPRLDRTGQPAIMGRGRELLWNTMRRLGTDFSIRELVALASVDDHPVAEVDAADYCPALAKAGYLVMTVPGKGGGADSTPTRYRFVPARNSGPRPPQIQRLKSIYDPNTHKVVWQEAPHVD